MQILLAELNTKQKITYNMLIKRLLLKKIRQGDIKNINKSKKRIDKSREKLYDKLNGNYELKNVEILKQFGIYNLRESFHIEKLTNKDLILSSESLYLYFRKF